jgi:hypothetical protein
VPPSLSGHFGRELRFVRFHLRSLCWCCPLVTRLSFYSPRQPSRIRSCEVKVDVSWCQELMVLFSRKICLMILSTATRQPYSVWLLDLAKPCEGILRSFVAHITCIKHRDSFLVNPFQLLMPLLNNLRHRLGPGPNCSGKLTPRGTRGVATHRITGKSSLDFLLTTKMTLVQCYLCL